MDKFNSIEDARKFLSDLQNNLKEFEDEGYYIKEEINKARQDIKSVESLCEDMKRENYSLWSQSTIMQNEVREIEESQPTIDDIIGGIDIRWVRKKEWIC